MEIPDKGPLHGPAAGEKPAEGSQQLSQSHSGKVPTRSIGKDTVSLTDKGREFNNAVDHARALPDVRLDRVMQLKRQLEEGTYRVKGQRIAVNMINETLENNHVLQHIDTNA